jgi:hypothetical protein
MAKQTADKIRALHSQLKTAIDNEGVSIDEVKQWKLTLAEVFREFNTFRKEVAQSDERHRAELSVLNEEMHDELVSREAIAARTADRFRALAESSAPHAVFDKAYNTAAVIELSIASLSSHSLSVNQGTVQLHQQLQEDGAGL